MSKEIAEILKWELDFSKCLTEEVRTSKIVEPRMGNRCVSKCTTLQEGLGPTAEFKKITIVTACIVIIYDHATTTRTRYQYARCEVAGKIDPAVCGAHM